MKEEKKFKATKKTLLGVALISIMLFGIAFGISFVKNDYNIKETVDEVHGWVKLPIVLGADVDPGNGNDGVVNIYIYPLASKSDVDTGCSEGTAYEHGDADGWSDGEELYDETPIGATYFVAIEVQFSNKAYNTTSADWDKTLVKCVGTCATLSLSSEEAEEGSDFFDQDGTTDAKLTFYWDNSDAGWTMTTGLSVDFTDFDIYYYA